MAAPIAKGARRSFFVNATTAQMMAANPNKNGSGAIVTTTPPNRARPAHTKAAIEKTLDATAWFG